MGRIERKIRQSIRREARADFQAIKESVVMHKPWYLPNFVWTRLVEAVLNSRVQDIKKGQLNG